MGKQIKEGENVENRVLPSYNNKLNFPNSIKHLFYGVDPLYISNLIFP